MGITQYIMSPPISAKLFLLSKSRRRCFAVDDGSVSGDGHRFRCSTVGELLRDSDWVSVIAVREKCDEKGLRADEGHRSVRCRQFAPQLFSVLSKNKPAFYSLVNLEPPHSSQNQAGVGHPSRQGLFWKGWASPRSWHLLYR